MTSQDLQAIQKANPPKEDRVDASSVSIDMDSPVAVRAQQYLAQIKNPYAFRCGDIGVNIEFTPDGKTLREAMVSYLTAQSQ